VSENLRSGFKRNRSLSNEMYLIDFLETHLGRSYTWGDDDCSGLVIKFDQMLNNGERRLPHSANKIRLKLELEQRRVDFENLKTGDLVF